MGKQIRPPMSLPNLILSLQQNKGKRLNKADGYLSAEFGKLYFQTDELTDKQKQKATQTLHDINKNPHLPNNGIERNGSTGTGVYLIVDFGRTWICAQQFDETLPDLDDVCAKLSDAAVQTVPVKPKKCQLRVFKAPEFIPLFNVNIYIRSKLDGNTHRLSAIKDLKIESKTDEVLLAKFVNDEMHTPLDLRNNYEFRYIDSAEWKPFGVFETEE